jgi:hypothetical protein
MKRWVATHALAVLVGCGSSSGDPGGPTGAAGSASAGGGAGAPSRGGAAGAPSSGGAGGSLAAGAGGAAGSATAALTEPEIEKLAATYATFVKANATPFVTQQHQGNPLVNVYANATAAPAYSAITPTAAGAVFPQGSMLVKEMLDPAGGPPILTVMYKLPPGYDDANGNWWRGRLNADGSSTGAGLTGKVSFCISCHAAAKSDGAFGLP